MGHEYVTLLSDLIIVNNHRSANILKMQGSLIFFSFSQLCSPRRLVKDLMFIHSHVVYSPLTVNVTVKVATPDVLTTARNSMYSVFKLQRVKLALWSLVLEALG